MSNPIVQAELSPIGPQPHAMAATAQLGHHGGPPPRSAEHPLLILQRHLRGRYPIALALALLFCIPGAIIGHKAVPPAYKSTGLVRVAPTIPKILYQNEENQLLPMFDSFVAAQAEYLQEPRVAQRAIQSAALQSAGWPSGPAGAAALAGALEVVVPRGSQIINVTVSHRNPLLAQVAVNAVLDAYAEIQEDLNGASVEKIEVALEQRVKDLQARVDSLRQQIVQLSTEQGTEDLDAINSAKLEALLNLDTSISQLDLQIARATAASVMGPEPLTPAADATINDLALTDAVLKGLLDEQEHLHIEQSAMAAKLAPNHRSMQDIQRRLDAVGLEIANRTKRLSQTTTDLGPAGRSGSGIPTTSSAVSISQLQATRDAQQRLRNSAFDDLRAIGATRSQIARLREDTNETKRDLDDAKTRLEQMRVERQNTKTGRISIVQRGDLPVVPSTDRRTPLTVFGGLFGIALGIGLVWGYGFVRNGYRYVDDLEHATISAPVLGIIPELGEGRTAEDEQAALSVHHIRNTLQLQASIGAFNGKKSAGGDVFTITSPVAGDGKTHLALALGLSFAMSGRRTLLIDADLVGRGLTHQLGLEQAKGLTEAVGADALNGEVHATRANLWALPAGASAEFRPEELSTQLVEQLLTAARASFDTVIVDSGPIMGSLEANLASPLSNRVVLVVSRGQNPKLVKAAFSRLRNAGAVCAGLVFNRAIPRDFLQSTSVVSTSARLPGASKRSRTAATSDLARVMQRDRTEPGAGIPNDS